MLNLEVVLWPAAAAAVVAVLAIALYVRSRRYRTIFISYRRSDSNDETAQIASALVARFGRRRVYRDVDSNAPGDRFRIAIRDTLRRCDAAVVMIGPTWLSATAVDGQLRLQHEEDLVRREVSVALSSGALVIPVLVRGALMPEAQALPAPLAPLAHRNAFAWSDEPGSRQAGERLVDAIASAPMRHTPLFLALCKAGAIVVLAMFALAGGFTGPQAGISFAVVAPGAATSLAALAAMKWNRRVAAARGAWAPWPRIGAPLGFLALLVLLIVLKATSIVALSFDTFLAAIAGVEVLWSGFAGWELAGMFSKWEDRDDVVA